MTGYIKNVNGNYPADMSKAGLVVTGQDETLLLDREYSLKTWSTEDNPLPDDQIIQQIGSQAGFKVQAQPGISSTSLYQNDTDIRFIKKRSEANGFEFYIRNGLLYFGPINLNGQPQSTILVYAGQATSCINFSFNYDGHLPDQAHGMRAVDTGTGQQEVTISPNLTVLGQKPAASNSMGLRPFVWTMQTPQGSNFSEVQARAQAKANENSFKIVAEGELDGALYRHVLLTYNTVMVDGLGKLNSGLYYVDKVTHVFSQDGYRQKFRLLRNATGETGF
jgi:phage protein D